MYVWLFLFVLFLVIEIVNPVTFDWLLISIASLITFFVSLVTYNFYLELILFTVLSGIFIVALSKKFLKNPESIVNGNVDLLIGKEFICNDDVCEKDCITQYYHKLNGTSWSIISDNGFIDKNSLCKIIRIDGNKLVVKKVTDSKKKN